MFEGGALRAEGEQWGGGDRVVYGAEGGGDRAHGGEDAEHFVAEPGGAVDFGYR